VIALDYIRAQTGKPWRKRCDGGLDRLKAPSLLDLAITETSRIVTAELVPGARVKATHTLIVQSGPDRARAKDQQIITIDGESTNPLPSSGDHILVDPAQRAPVPPGIFVTWDCMAIVAKRTEFVPHSDLPKTVIKSLNPEYQI
jgi:hypothetical protein